MIRAVLAVNEDNLIGEDGKMPWKSNKKDMRWFMDHTSGDTVVMGSNTWKSEDMPSPLPNRKNVVVSSKDPSNFEGAEKVVSNLEELEKYFRDNIHKNIWIIGGANLIKQCDLWINEYYLTIMKDKKVIEHRDNRHLLTYFPLDSRLVKYKRTFQRDHSDLTFEVWSRK